VAWMVLGMVDCYKSMDRSITKFIYKIKLTLLAIATADW